MKPFKHINAYSIDEAVDALTEKGTAIIAGGTDLMGALKDNILPEYPRKVVNIKTINGLEYIKEDDKALHIGALTKLRDISTSELIVNNYTALAQAASAVASPNIREMATIGGNITQMPRCWYFRKPENRFNCIRKGGKECYAILGKNKFHSVFGGKKFKDSACTQECPAGTDIPAYMEQIRFNNWDNAAKIIMSVNPMPAITSRVCAHFCKSGCNRCKSDECVNINSVERALGDYILDNSDKFYVKPETSTGKSVAVVGSGPSGLSAAFYLCRAGNKVTVYDAKQEAGGILMYGIPAYRLPKNIVRRLVRALEKMGIVFKTNTCIGKDIYPEYLDEHYDSVCYATGAWKRPMVGLAREELTVFGLDFLTQINEWLCSNVEEEVIVTGGGNVAIDVAISAKRLGAAKVTIICLESIDKMPASEEEILRAKNEGIAILDGWGLKSIVEQDNVIKGLIIKRCISVKNKEGRFSPVYDEKETLRVKANSILMAVGQQVDLSFLSKEYKLRLTQKGLIDVIDDTAMTSKKGVFACGDVTTGPATVIRAISNGRKAANGIISYLDIHISKCDKVDRYLSVDCNGIQNVKAQKPYELPLMERTINKEDTLTFSKDIADDEAKRCLNCGCYTINTSDIAPALIVLKAKVITTQREIDIDNFFDVGLIKTTILRSDEIILEIRIPKLDSQCQTVFKKFSFRKSIDFPVVNCAIALGDSPRICINAVAPIPYRAIVVEELLSATEIIDEQKAEMIGEAAVESTVPLKDNKYKIQIIKTLIKRSLLEMAK